MDDFEKFNEQADLMAAENFVADLDFEPYRTGFLALALKYVDGLLFKSPEASQFRPCTRAQLLKVAESIRFSFEREGDSVRLSFDGEFEYLLQYSYQPFVEQCVKSLAKEGEFNLLVSELNSARFQAALNKNF